MSRHGQLAEKTFRAETGMRIRGMVIVDRPISQLAIAAGFALGGVVVDSAGLASLFVISGIVAVASAIFGLLARPAV